MCIVRFLKTTLAPSNWRDFPSFGPRTKHINVCYHHFCEHVGKGLIKIFPVDTKDQIANALTKPLAQNDFQHHHCFLCSKSPSQAIKVRECYVLSTLVLIFRCMFRSIVISSISSSDQLNFTVTKCVVSLSVKRFSNREMIKLSSARLSVCKEFLPILNSSIIVNIILCAIWY